MPIVTYFSGHEAIDRGFEDDSLLVEYLNKARSLTGRTWFVRVSSRTIRRWFRKTVIRKTYSMYLECSKPEYQIVNFPGGKSSIHTNVSREELLAFLMGLECGCDIVFKEARDGDKTE